MRQFTHVPYPPGESGILALMFGKILSSLDWRHFWEDSFIFGWATKFTDVRYPPGESGILALMFGKILSSLDWRHFWEDSFISFLVARRPAIVRVRWVS
ncbi:hypothetical protein [Microseira wollei]|uniref:hypothetical protein n=1 Tax=Microseira wollei TaxID=467598 RepID=UPI001CFE0545|nr:hypothetical protein [Microseira wollei]